MTRKKSKSGNNRSTRRGDRWTPKAGGQAKARQDIVLRHLRSGNLIEDATAKAGVTRSAHDKWLAKDPVYRRAVERIRQDRIRREPAVVPTWEEAGTDLMTLCRLLHRDEPVDECSDEEAELYVDVLERYQTPPALSVFVQQVTALVEFFVSVMAAGLEKTEAEVWEMVEQMVDEEDEGAA